jgi:transketolase C-terminal domain/subunit
LFGTLDKKLTSFGWRVFDLDGNQYGPIVDALRVFKNGARDGRPTAIISHTSKGWGSFSNFLVNHKVEIPDQLTEQEIEAQKRRRGDRVAEFMLLWSSLGESTDGMDVKRRIAAVAEGMSLDLPSGGDGGAEIRARILPAKTRRAPVRDKSIAYDASLLPVLDPGKEYAASALVTQAMKVFARDPRVVSVDSDLSSTSGLEAGVGWVDAERALNVGIAEANMTAIGEAYAALGYNAWVSTFCPFFDWKVIRRIAIGYQERIEAIAQEGGWLNKGHGLDLTFLATAPNFETKTNGATHMGNDDALVFGEIGHLKIVDVSCPNQLLGIMKWIMQGDRGLVYLRIMRSPSAVLYPNGFRFDFGKAYAVREGAKDQVVIVSSGRGVHEALAAANELEKQGVSVGVVDMPSVDRGKLLELASSGKLTVFAEQNNGFIWSSLGKVVIRSGRQVDTERLLAINTLDKEGLPAFIHSGTYDQLLDQFALRATQIASRIMGKLQESGRHRSGGQ